MIGFQIGMLVGAWGALLFGIGSVYVAIGVTVAVLLQWAFAAISAQENPDDRTD